MRKASNCDPQCSEIVPFLQNLATYRSLRLFISVSALLSGACFLRIGIMHRSVNLQKMYFYATFIYPTLTTIYYAVLVV